VIFGTSAKKAILNNYAVFVVTVRFSVFILQSRLLFTHSKALER